MVTLRRTLPSGLVFLTCCGLLGCSIASGLTPASLASAGTSGHGLAGTSLADASPIRLLDNNLFWGSEDEMTARQAADTEPHQHIYVVDRFPSYSETFVSTEISSLIERGSVVSVYSLHPPHAQVKGVAEYLARPHSALRMLLWVMPGAVLLISHVARGLRMNLRSLPKMVFASAHAARLAASVRVRTRTQGQQVVLHAHFLARPADVIALASYWIPSALLLVTSHAGDAKDRRDPRLRRWRLGKADHVIAASQYVLDHLAGEVTRASIVHCGIETSRLPRILRVPTDDNGLSIATVARLIPTKGYDRAVAITKALAAGYSSPITWHVVGDGPMKQDIEAASEELLAAGVTVVLHGAQPHELTLEILAACDLFLLPSQVTTDSENAGDGIPVAILEAMAMGKLVVTTRAGGIPEAVIDGQTGLLITTESDKEISKRIINIIRDDVGRGRISANAKDKIKNEFEASASAVAIERIVLSLLQDQAATTRQIP